MKAALPDWYRGWADGVLQLRAAGFSELAFERSAWLAGYLSALFMADLISTAERTRMGDVGNNAFLFALKNLKHPIHKKEA